MIIILSPGWWQRRKAEKYMREKLCESREERRLRELA